MQKTASQIKLFGSTVLRQKAKTVARIEEKHRQILSQMSQIMYDNAGIGLAAPQIGLLLTMIVVDIGSGLYKLINPRISKRQGLQKLEEGCLSLPGISIAVERAKKITLEAMDEFGKPLTIEAEGLLACVFQHEIDHLNGKLIVDYAGVMGRMRLRKKLAQLKASCGS